MRILIADDDPQLVRALRVTLGARGYDVVTAPDGTAAVNAVIEQHPDLLLLDLGMPGLSGVEVIEAVRGWSTMPILVVSGRTDASDKVDALDAGADDYVTKPFVIDELLARVRALGRRVGPAAASDPVIAFGGVTVDLASRSVGRAAPTGGGSEHIRLTPTEWKILELLARNAGRLVSREHLLTEVWGSHHTGDSGYLRLYVGQLRKKLEANPSEPQHLLTEPGRGYRLVLDEA
ncbi:response regulator transcription factor [Labedella phragmitis]|uniref:Response regulator transcription factor n=1 Tax=Labedella phragmitis TaxID=2498849 RepID=A0A444PT31_9MICO|nr:response regulator transcription factor [Labedella phragmitis]RWZ51016.1 response regulator transcription factor [Labedella phragmitis]